MAVDDFRITYRGEALDAGTMDVRDLAPALLALSSAIRETSRIHNGERSDVQVHLKAVSNNCFSVDLSMVQTTVENLFAVLTGDGAQKIDTLLSLLGIGGVGGVASGLIWFVKKLRGKIPAKAEKIDAGDEQGRPIVRVTLPDGTTIDVMPEVWQLYQNPIIRKALGQVVAPLNRDGIEKIEFVSEGEVGESIEQSEVGYFDLPDINEQLLFEEQTKSAFTIVNLSFKERNKWRLNDGNSTEFVTIEDEAFLSKVEASEVAFRKSDVLICEVRVRVTQTPSGLKTERFIERVVEHVPAMQQLPLDVVSSKHEDGA